MKYHDKVEDLPDEPVIVIDTLTRMIKDFPNDTAIVEFIEDLTPKFTVIVVGHTADFVGKDGIFRDCPLLARNSSETLWLDKAEYKATKLRSSYIEYNLHVNKGRGSGGARLIEGWMR